jgi:small subunit ribosomal protein S20
MPIKKSAIKALKQSEKKRVRNVAKKRTLKSVLKKTTTIEGLPKAQSVIDRVAKTGLIHKNKASRIKSRLSKRLVKAASEEAVVKPVKKTVKKSPRSKKK